MNCGADFVLSWLAVVAGCLLTVLIVPYLFPLVEARSCGEICQYMCVECNRKAQVC